MLKTKAIALAISAVVGASTVFTLIQSKHYDDSFLQKANENITKYQKEVEANTVKLKDIISGKSSQIQNLHKEYADIAEERDNKDSQVKILKAANLDKDNKIQSISKERDSKVKQISDLIKEKETLNNSIKDLSTNLTNVENDNKSKDSELKTAKEKIKAYEEKINKLQNEISECNSLINDDEKYIKENQNFIKQQQCEMNKANKEIDNANTTAKDFLKSTENLKAPDISDIK